MYIVFRNGCVMSIFGQISIVLSNNMDSLTIVRFVGCMYIGTDQVKGGGDMYTLCLIHI